MFKWKKLGNIFDPTALQTPGWMDQFAQAPAVVVFEDYIRVYFSCRPKPDENGQFTSYSAFVELNRQNLSEILNVSEKPIISLGALGTFDEFGTYPVSVIRSGKNFMAYYGGWTRCESVPFNVNIGAAISHDNGVTFEKLGDGPILSYSHDEPFILSGPKIRFFEGRYHLFYIAGKRWILDNGKPEPVYKIRMAVSEDGINFSKHHKDLIADVLGEDEAQASPDVIYLNGKYHMFFCFRYGKNYRGKEFGYRIGYASSIDLVNWKREDDKAGITISDEGWDSEMVSYPTVFELDGKIYMLYLGNQVGKNGFGLAVAESHTL